MMKTPLLLVALLVQLSLGQHLRREQQHAGHGDESIIRESAPRDFVSHDSPEVESLHLSRESQGFLYPIRPDSFVNLGASITNNQPPTLPPVTGLDIECGSDSITVECGLQDDSRTNTGIFVCRNVMGTTYTACVAANSGHAGDTCGCCEGRCPTMCKCPCLLHNNEVGVEIQRVDDASHVRCVSPLGSLTRQLGGSYVCGTC